MKLINQKTNLPADWQVVKLGVLIEENRKSPLKVEDAKKDGLYPFFTSGETVLSYDNYLVDGENLFLSTGGSAYIKHYVGKAAYSSDTWSLKTTGKIVPKFLYFELLSFLHLIDALLFSGSGLKHLQKGDLKELEVSIPSKPEQQKIVYVLDTIQEAIGAQEELIEKTKELKRAMMAKLFREGTRGEKLKKTEVGEIPESWEVMKLGDKNVAQIIMGQSPPSSSYNEDGAGFPFLQGKAEFGDTYPSAKNWTSKPLKIAQTGDILISVRAPVGDVNIADRDYSIGRGLAAIHAQNSTDTQFLFYFFSRNKAVFENFGSGSTFKAIGSDILKNFLIPFPSIKEQREIANILQTIDQKIEIEQKKKELYEELFRTMLNKLMTAEIRVKDVEFK